jgi:hypothetical protein
LYWMVSQTLVELELRKKILLSGVIDTAWLTSYLNISASAKSYGKMLLGVKQKKRYRNKKDHPRCLWGQCLEDDLNLLCHYEGESQGKPRGLPTMLQLLLPK